MNEMKNKESQNIVWDAIVIGSGIGGASAAYELIQAHKKVLVLEKGPGVSSETKKLPLWRQPIFDVVNKREFSPFLGEGLGGSSRLYGMVMERLEESDFKSHGGMWPESLLVWDKYFTQAEKIFNVTSALMPKEFDPFLKHLSDKKIKPYPLSLSYKKRPDCLFCQSRLCEKSCKVDAWSGPLSKVADHPNLTIITDARVEKILTNSDEAYAVEVVIDNEVYKMKGKSFYLGLGGLLTPYLMWNSKNSTHPKGIGNSKDLLGRYLMRHYVDLYFLDWKGSHEVKDYKSIGIKDHYKEAGIFQSFGSLPPMEYVIDEVLGKASWIRYIPGVSFFLKIVINSIFSKHVMASIMEDAPSASNRLIFTDGKSIGFEYKISPEEKTKIERSREIGKQIFSPMLKRIQFEAENNKRLAHACGTCKMGESIEDSVVDWHGRVHDMKNVFVVDASVFPSSTGKNPSLTIAAHAIRATRKSLMETL